MSIYDVAWSNSTIEMFDGAKKLIGVPDSFKVHMDKVDIFESFYIPKRISEGWVLVKGGRNDGERFQVEWKVGDESIAAKYNDGESTVTEKLKKKK